MEIYKRVGFRKDVLPDLCCYLEDNGIPYSETDMVCTTTINASSPHWPYLCDYVQQNSLPCFSETVFTNKELLEAEWLHLRSRWRFGYPQPESNFAYETITYDSGDCCPLCGIGLNQINPFQIKKTPRWGNRHFAELNWIGDELFIDSTAKSVLENSGISGISFRCVKDKSGKQTLPDIFQLSVSYILEDGLVNNVPSIHRTSLCPHCGKKKFLTSGMGSLVFKKEIFSKAPDIVKTSEHFGDGHYASRLFLVRNNFYQTIISNQIGKHLVFEPVELV